MRCQPLSESDSFPARPGLRFVIPLVFIPVVFVVAPLAATAEEPSDQAAARDPATNRLAKESSPYLLQHAHNPVDWYPWGDEAFERARRENKPVFLSVGYAACHWCHVMERETFTDEEIAAEMNERFVCIKVDREERPDVDQIYMTAVQLISGQGGWPMSVFMTPEAKPFWGGTYFPARDGDRGNATGFLTIVRRIDELWQEQPDLVSQQATAVTEAIRQNQGPAAADDDEPAAMPNATDIVRVAEALAGQHDPEYGGFGYSEANPNRPKFPEPSNLLFLLDRMTRDSVAAEDRESAEAMLVRSLDGMLSGAMWDHVAGGFHRYSVDRRWQIPHFEKMLYDNAQLAPIYAAASVATGREEYRDVAIRTCEFVIRDLRADGGAFYASLDADTEGEEGKYYRWTDKDLESLKEGDIPDFKLAADVFRLDGPANFEGEYHVPAAGVSLTAAANRRDLTYGVLDERLAATRRAMFDVRRARTPPPTDVKILTAWNGLMIAGLADTGRILERPEFVRVAEQAATFLLENLRDDRAEGDEAEGDGGRLLRSYAGGEAKLNAYADDYAFLASGLLAIHRATGEAEWLDRARGLVDDQIERYWDEQDGGLFYTSDDHPTLIVRVKDPIDAEIPSAASVTAENLLMLAERTGRDEYRERFDATMRSLGPVFDALPAGVPRAAAALATALDR